MTLSFQDFYDEKVGRARNRYFWNYEMLKHLVMPEKITEKDDEEFYKLEWCVPVIQGHYGSF